MNLKEKFFSKHYSIGRMRKNLSAKYGEEFHYTVINDVLLGRIKGTQSNKNTKIGKIFIELKKMGVYTNSLPWIKE